ncbi:MAG TPA: hypothetical protein VLE49_04575 [Anaerolineales bacterium]|nr:hypothetical protein [Anaerolineales bacterium]
MKAAILLLISLGLIWFSEEFSPVTLFEPQATGWILWFSYAKDLVQPFALYFFTCLMEKWLKTWQARAVSAFAVPVLLEFGQLLNGSMFAGHYIGSFDPLDMIMYATGVGLAVIVEQKVFAKLLKFW